MSESLETHHDEERDTLENAEDGVHRLLDIITQEVSLVTRAANKRKFLVRKGSETMENGQEVFEQEDGTLSTSESEGEADSTEEEQVEKAIAMPKAVKAAVAASLDLTKAKTDKLIANLKAASESADASGLPAEAAEEFKGIASALRAILSRYPTPKAKDGEGDVEKSEDTRRSALNILSRVMSRVHEGALDGEEVKAAEGKLLAALKEAISKSDDQAIVDALEGIEKDMPHMVAPTPPKAADESGEEPAEKPAEKQAWDIPAGLKAKALSIVEGILDRVKAMASLIAGATENDEAVPQLPPELVKEIEAAATVLEGVAAYPSPKSGEQKKDADTAAKASPAETLKEVLSVLGVVLAKVQPGKSMDEDSYQRLDKLRGLLKSFSTASAETSGAEAEGQAAEKADEGKSTDVEKAGAKMAASRRRKFQDAIKSLIALFKEVMPASELGKMPHLQVKKSADAEEADTLRSKLSDVEAKLETTREELRKVGDRPAESNLSVVETVEAVSEQVVWPSDLNSEV